MLDLARGEKGELRLHNQNFLVEDLLDEGSILLESLSLDSVGLATKLNYQLRKRLHWR